MPITQWDPAVARAKEQLPNIDLNLTMTDISQGGWAGYSDNIVTLIAGGEQLDVIMIAIEGLGLLTGKKILAPLDDFLASDTAAKELLEKDVHPTLRTMLQVDGKQMEYPFSWNNMVTYYNTKIFEDKGVEAAGPDWTWDQFLDACDQDCRCQGRRGRPVRLFLLGQQRVWHECLVLQQRHLGADSGLEGLEPQGSQGSGDAAVPGRPDPEAQGFAQSAGLG